MREFFPLFFATVVILILGAAEVLLLAFLNRPWWNNKRLRIASWVLPLIGVVAVALWGWGEYSGRDWLAWPGAVLAVVTLVSELALMISLPLSGCLHIANWILDRFVRKRSGKARPVDSNRRAVLKTVAAGLPLLAVSMGGAGVTRAFAGVNVFLKPIHFDSLSPGLNGLRILHLTDLHLGHYVRLDDLEVVLAEADLFKPDLVVVSGDIADDLSQLGDAINMMNSLGPRLGVYACLGNHEYFRGLTQVKRTFERSPVPLLIDQAETLDACGSRLLLGGIDDPRRMRGADRAFFKRHIDQCFSTADSQSDFTLLISHRPDALDYASETGVDLTLAGHTHGGQVGLWGHSLFESVWPRQYLWGHYRKDGSHLYTSSGVGHWFPFRLGCPPEAPVIELRSS